MVEISQHPWVKGTTLFPEQMRDEFILRKKKVDMDIERQKKEKEQKKAQRSEAIFNRKDNRDVDADTQNFLTIY